MPTKILKCPICKSKLKPYDGCKCLVFAVCPNCGYEKRIGEGNRM